MISRNSPPENQQQYVATRAKSELWNVMSLKVCSHLKYKKKKKASGRKRRYWTSFLACVMTVRIDYYNFPVWLYQLEIFKIMFCTTEMKLEIHAKTLENYCETW